MSLPHVDLLSQTPPLPWGCQDLQLLPGGGTAEKQEARIQLGRKRGYLEWMCPVFLPRCPTVLHPPCSPPQPVMGTPPQELSAALPAQNTAQHVPALGCTGCSKHKKSDDIICITCCHCPEMFSLVWADSVPELLGNLICSFHTLQGKLPLPGCCTMALKVFRRKLSSHL